MTGPDLCTLLLFQTPPEYLLHVLVHFLTSHWYIFNILVFILSDNKIKQNSHVVPGGGDWELGTGEDVSPSGSLRSSSCCSSSWVNATGIYMFEFSLNIL